MPKFSKCCSTPCEPSYQLLDRVKRVNKSWCVLLKTANNLHGIRVHRAEYSTLELTFSKVCSKMIKLHIGFKHRFLLFNIRIHNRLREHRFIDFAMTETSIADQIDNNIAIEFLTPFGGHVTYVHDGFRIVSVDVENWAIDDTAHVGTIG
uniref:Uncharacterized protein n=1 Tax=Romanomermis culicivorax TaxID=13658 RepID=A0A915ICU6_ROMCU